jgi:hypothetical protein
MAKPTTVDAYVASLAAPLADVATAVRDLIRAAAPEASEAVKWAQPVYEQNGPFAYFRASSKHVTFGFWRGAELDDPNGLLEGTGEQMRHVKLASADGIDREALAAFVRQAVELNRAKGDPTRRA